jgi:large subunit ribosomal protein L21
MYAFIEAGGKQFKVAAGDSIRIDTLEGDAGASVTLGKVIALVDDAGKMITGAAAAKATVTGTITEHDRAKKVIIFKFKRKKQYRRTQGHRQNYTEVKIDAISA